MLVQPKAYFKDTVRIEECWSDRMDKVRLNRNERSYPLSDAFINEIKQALSNDLLTAYPDVDAFKSNWCDFEGVDEKHIMVTPGSDEAIKTIFQIYVDPGDEVVVLENTYKMYSVYAGMYGANVVEVTYAPDFSLKVSDILTKITNNTKLVCIANPNQTGDILSTSCLKTLMDYADKQGFLLLIDEAYFGFGSESCLPFVNQYTNLIVTRSFSKTYGLAGVRIGGVFASTDVITYLKKLRMTHEITAASVIVANILLGNSRYYDEYNMNIVTTKKYIVDRLTDNGFVIHSGFANFIWVKLSSCLCQYLESKKYLLPGITKTGCLQGFVRVTIGSLSQMRQLCDDITHYIHSKEAVNAAG